MKKIIIGCDHAGYELKGYLIEQLQNEIEFNDVGTHSDQSVDYPDMIHPVAQAVSSGEFAKGIIICGSGNGVAMTANKHKDVRAALCWDIEIAELARLHNDANILSLPARYIDSEKALKITKLFLETEFEGGRHQRRVEKIEYAKV